MLALSKRLCSTGAKSVEFGGNARQLMLSGIERIATAVSVTLGPKGRNVIIRQANGEPQITKDGVTVARSIELHDQFEDMGAKLIRQVASKTNDVAGDGTTTATILAWSIFAEGYKSVTTGANPMDLKRGVDLAVQVILRSLDEQCRRVDSHAMLEQVATISANGESELGNVIAEVVQAIGEKGEVAVVDGNTSTTEWTRYDGWSVETGFVHSDFVTDHVLLQSSLANPLIYITCKPMTEVQECLSLLDMAVMSTTTTTTTTNTRSSSSNSSSSTQQKNCNTVRPLVLVAPSFSDQVIQTVLLNHVEHVIHGGLVSVHDVPLDELHDLAIACGTRVHMEFPAQLIRHAHNCAHDSSHEHYCNENTENSNGNYNSNNNNNNVKVIGNMSEFPTNHHHHHHSSSSSSSLFGNALHFTQNMDCSIICGEADVHPRVHLLQRQLTRLMTEHERLTLRRRIAKLQRNYAVIRVGGRSSLEITEIKDRVIDALNASRSALAEGVVAGGGAALLHASKKLDELLASDDTMEQDRRTGVQIVRNAIRLPVNKISENAGEEGAVTVENVLEYQDTAMGYDAQKGEYVNMFEAGIVDPLCVVRSCVIDAASVAGLMITTEASVCDYTVASDQRTSKLLKM